MIGEEDWAKLDIAQANRSQLSPLFLTMMFAETGQRQGKPTSAHQRKKTSFLGNRQFSLNFGILTRICVGIAIHPLNIVFPILGQMHNTDRNEVAICAVCPYPMKPYL